MKTLMTKLLAGALMTASLFAWAEPASARRLYAVDAEYYSGPDYNQLVGEVHSNCDGTGSQWGVRTPYVIRETTPCP
jgi:hypothetical protein